MMLVDEFRTAAATLAHAAAGAPEVARRMTEMRSGYPTKTVGASSGGDAVSVLDIPDNPGDDGDENPDERDARTVQLTQVERDALAMIAGQDRIDADTIELRELLVQVSALVRRIDTLCTPYLIVPTTARSRALTEAPKDWCTSCYRDGQHHEPVTVDGRGRHHYETMCRWCGDFHKEHGALPPMPVLRARHEGRRVTVQMVERHIRKGSKPAHSTDG